ncbi:iron-containing redox enzyme family protein [Pseudomonas sp. BJa5]|uniref:iron-containing redox enzyme family protein n=1 Tax=Pseudomonas sp. BJa5 TaxID=2936270 RepID=UPI002559E36C|nr:iron-containing redox enzyme family protein [Pseudomonas sp. BGr12]MDL2423935.1 iron-containing redox enzyme family protein [Pseudomonas sp. BGr12]
MSVSIASTVQTAGPWEARSALQQRYQNLLQGAVGDSHEWLLAQLQRAEALPDELPANPADLGQWGTQRAAAVARHYADYLAIRKAGAPRRYFSNRAHALYFLQQVAPTKAVDGAWLYGTLRHWPDPRFHGLIRTYLEELGEGDPASNHVLIYRRLLSELGCHQDLPLSAEHYLQGTLQLALGLNTEAFLPELIGYNLGYEQLPLHLLISAYELDELGIDPHYFRLHVTIDNASSGHACKALQALRQLWPQQGGTPFYQRVARGYRLNDLGPGAQAIIDSFDLEAELLASLERKRGFGQHMHSDYCRIEGRTVNQWLAHTNLLSGFLAVLQRKGWIRRDRDPGQSRFWRLVDGPGAAMFGVFDPYEKQLLHDWIAGTWQPLAKPTRMPTLKVDPLIDDEQEQALEATLQALPPQTRIEQLIKDMSGNRHALPRGLWATRRFAQMTGLHR